MHVDDDLIGRERGGERTEKEFGGRDRARAGLADDGDLRLAGHRDARHLGCRIGMRDAAADRAAIAHLVMRDMRDRGGEQRMRGRKPRVILDVAPAHHGAEVHAVRGDPDLPQLLELAQVDEQRGRGKPECKHRHQALAAGERLRVPVARREQRNCLRQRRGARIFKRRHFHG